MNWKTATQEEVLDFAKSGGRVPTDEVAQLLARGIVIHHYNANGNLSDPAVGIPAVQSSHSHGYYRDGELTCLVLICPSATRVYNFDERGVWSLAEEVTMIDDRLHAKQRVAPDLYRHSVDGVRLEAGIDALAIRDDGARERVRVVHQTLAGTLHTCPRSVGRWSSLKWTPAGLPTRETKRLHPRFVRLIPDTQNTTQV